MNTPSSPAAARTLPPTTDHTPADNPDGWLLPSDDFFRVLLNRPELALVPESCAAELFLHNALQAEPMRPVADGELAALQDADARESYTLFLRFRDGLMAKGSLQAYYLGLFAAPAPGGPASAITIPPLFIDLLVQAILRHLLDGHHPTVDAYTLRAADMLCRPQRITTQNGQVLAGDLHTLDMLNDTGGLGDMGRFLREAKAPVPTVNMQVLADDNAPEFLAAWQQQGLGSSAHQQQRFLLDLTHEVTHDLSHGLVFKMTRARSGLKALAQVLTLWVWHFLGVEVNITPLQKIDDAAWRWHIGLDAGASALLDDLYEDRAVEPARLQRLVSLFRLDFLNPLEMRADVAGKPVYLGLMMTVDGVVKLKPQNLLINLPLRRAE